MYRSHWADVPGVVRIGLGAIAKLVPAQRVFGGRRELDAVWKLRPAESEVQLAQQAADAKEHAAVVVADDRHDRGGAGFVAGLDGGILPFPCRGSGEETAREVRVGRSRGAGLARARSPARRHVGQRSETFHSMRRAIADFLDQEPRRLVLGSGETVGHDDDGFAQVDWLCHGSGLSEADGEGYGEYPALDE